MLKYKLIVKFYFIFIMIFIKTSFRTFFLIDFVTPVFFFLIIIKNGSQFELCQTKNPMGTKEDLDLNWGSDFFGYFEKALSIINIFRLRLTRNILSIF